MNKMILTGLALMSMRSLQSMQQVEMKSASDVQHTCRVVTGDIFFMSVTCLTYRGYQNNGLFERLKNLVDVEGKQLVIQPHEMLAQVWATSANNTGDWSTIAPRWSSGHSTLGNSTFPEDLPLSLLDGKNEGELITFHVKNPQTQEIFKIELTCKQLGHRYQESGDFQTTLAALKSRTARIMPNFDYRDADALVEAAIIVKRGEKYAHGLNGFTFQPIDNQNSDESSENIDSGAGKCIIQ